MVNGDLSQDLSVGWVQVIDWNPAKEKNAGTNLAKVESKRLYLAHIGNSIISLSQDIPVLSANLIFKVKARFQVKGNAPTLSRARIRLIYLKDDAVLGENIIEANTGAVADKAPTTRQRYVFLKEYVINIADEIAEYLSGIKPAEVNKIGIVLNCDGTTATDRTARAIPDVG